MVKDVDKKALAKALLKGKEVGYSKRTKEKAIDRILTEALAAGINFTNKPKGVPGELIKAMPKEIRDILEECTPEDWNHRMEKTNWTKR